ncbi:protein crumbs [Lingula anatina]|uniref:Protein crumbs n=1 Tax=Lingula anatina TaxID=7574 RepID=A0A1S3JPB7_LINAN|nr:protein crumbs [Lingula anatina]|eukprot:XP_013412192.1 protein crumbs [Lingula anatina]
MGLQFRRDITLTEMLLLVLLLACCQLTQAQFQNKAYFNSSAYVESTNTFDVHKRTTFQFRTCSEGQLLSDHGANGDSIEFYVNTNGSLLLKWNASQDSVSNILTIGQDLNNNNWYKLSLKYQVGNVTLTIEQGSNKRYERLIANSTYNSDFKNLNFTGGSPLTIGRGYLGCIEGALTVELDKNIAGHANVDWGNCPLESQPCSDFDINDCWSQPCQNAGVCQDGFKNYTCVCPPPYSGRNCETDLGASGCQTGLCKNGATCVDVTGQTRLYECRCVPGYTGTHCENEVKECDSQPCKNGGQCTDQINSFVCNCTGTGYTGVDCTDDMDECSASPCQNGATCQNNQGTYSCICSPGYDGNNCEREVDECASSPCLNGATCNDGLNTYTCTCAAGFSGENCQTNLDDCVGVVCPGDNVICVDYVLNYKCECAPGFTGTYVCNCTGTGFNGTHCELNIDECAVYHPCQNGATCTDGINDYNCTCWEGYQGKNCEIDINECESNPCRYNSTCLERSDLSLYQQGYLNFNNFNFSTAAGYVCECVPGSTGVNCEVNIDECNSNPCVHGTCNDILNGYTCACEAGWTGTHCETEINECDEYQPCKNGATCTDKLADYTCQCAGPVQGTEYGGKNCTVQLIGCANNACQNGATCRPYLVTETPAVHNYTCSCPSGFTGFYCEVPTSASFNGTSYMVLNSTQNWSNFTLVLWLRTTLLSGVLMYHQLPSGDSMLLTLAGHNLQFTFNQVTGNPVRFASENQRLKDGEWHQIELAVNSAGSTKLHIYGNHCPGGVCTYQDNINVSSPLTFGTTYIGSKVMAGAIDQSEVTFIGCTRDIVLNGQLVVPQDVPNSLVGVYPGCNREVQCVPDPCSGKGVCTDLWWQYKCRCLRKYTGPQCNQTFPAATFSQGSSSSLAQFTIPARDKNLLQYVNVISMFIRTRQPDGFIFYLGGVNTNSPGDKAFISAELKGTSLHVILNLFNTTEQGYKRYEDNLGSNLNDGSQHLIEVDKNRDKLEIRIDSVRLSGKTMTATLLNPAKMYVGGLPGLGSSSSGRRRRQTLVEYNPDSATVQEPFKGTIQDARLNDKLLLFYNVSVPDDFQLNESYPVTLDGVVEGEQTDDLCATGNLCENNGTCNNVFFNDFICDCPKGYKGKNCSALDFCMYSKCPEDSTCRDLADGYECITEATFNGMDSLLRYNNTINSTTTFNQMSLKFRTRKENAIIFHARSNAAASRFLTIEVSERKLNLKYNLGESSELPTNWAVTDGQYHNVSIVVNDTHLTLAMDQGQDEKSKSKPQPVQAVTLAQVIRGSDMVFLGGIDDTTVAISPNTNTQSALSKFKGCMDEVRLGRYLLPFFFNSALVNDSSLEKFQVMTKASIVTPCTPDPVCAPSPCKNGATCVDIFNDFTCQCPLGFNGRLCENNIDDCPGNECQNGATCVDGIANYTCTCQAGYTDARCQTDIDECASSPCQNNATCIDKVNAFECNCTANFTGPVCETHISDTCASEPCENNATCVDINRNETEPGQPLFKCNCVRPFEGQLCEKMINYCEDQPCQNRGTCINDYTLFTYQCNCSKGYSGRNCTVNRDDCPANACSGHGQCVDGLDTYTCNCNPGWAEWNCSRDIDECTEINPCVHGTCTNAPAGSYTCSCDKGYQGKNCSEDVNECETERPCKNGAICYNLVGSYFCNCSTLLGYSGKDCEIANCSFSQCQNGATCEVFDNSTTQAQQWLCVCPEFYAGSQCDVKHPCADNPCQNAATCSDDDPARYQCICGPGWEGDTCADDIDECAIGRCQNNASCTNSQGGYACACILGFTGTNCETNIDDCAGDPCVHGNCSDLVNEYSCQCEEGWQGVNCSEDINECLKTPCQNGATCNNLLGSYNCTCTAQFLGPNCEYEDPCKPGVCSNGGSCLAYREQEGMYSAECTCLDGYAGVRCETMRSTQDTPLAVIIGPVVGGVVLLIVIAVIIFLVMARSKRATRGTYSPSRQEMQGSRVELGNVLKPPPEERLI